MIFYYVLILNLQIVIEGSSFSCPPSIPTVSYVSSCPKNKQEWEAAARSKNCEAIHQNCTNFQYHCLLNQKLNRTLEVCAPVYFLQGFCATYSIQKKQIIENYEKGYECLKYNGSEKCPTRYPSSESYKYQKCYSFYTDRENHTGTIPPQPASTSVKDLGNQCRDDDRAGDNSGIGVMIWISFVVVCLTIVIHIVLWKCREKIFTKLCKREVIVVKKDEEGGNLLEKEKTDAEKLAEATEENENLKKQIKEQREKIEEAYEEKQQLRNQIEETQEKLTEATKENENLKIQNQGQHEKLEEAKKEEEKLRNQIKELHEKLGAATKENENLKIQNQGQHAKLEEAKKEEEKLRNQIKELQDNLTQEKSGGEKKIIEVKQLNEELQRTEQKLQEKEEKANEQKQKLEKQIEEQLKKLEKANTEKKNLEEKLEKAKDKKKNLEEKLEEVNEEKKNSERKIEEQSGEKQADIPKVPPPRPSAPPKRETSVKEGCTVDDKKTKKHAPQPPSDQSNRTEHG